MQMENDPETISASEGLEELLETHISRLTEKLSRPYTLDEIEAELSALNDVVYTFKLRDELLEKLFDEATAEKLENARETLLARRIRMAKLRAAAGRIKARSHEILERSAQLV